mgnify:FL=1
MTRTEEKRLRAFAATLRGSGLDMRARELEEMLPKRTRRPASPPRAPGKSKEERRQEKREARQATRKLCEERAGGYCEAALYIHSRCDGPLTWDHYWGRGKVPPNHEAEWMICRGHHDEKGAGDPTRQRWHEAFREHALRHGYAEQIDRCDRFIALERAQHPEAA